MRKAGKRADGRTGERADRGTGAGRLPLLHNFLDVVIYAVCEGQRTRIGVAGGSRYTLMDVPRRLLGPGQEMRLVGDAIGSNLVRSSVGVY